jgi:hypothetical protein
LVHRAQREKKATTGMKKENVKKEEKRYMPLSSSNTVRGDWNDREKKELKWRRRDGLDITTAGMCCWGLRVKKKNPNWADKE